MQKDLTKKKTFIEKMTKEFEQKARMMNDAKRIEKQQEIQKLMVDYRQVLSQSQMNMQKKQMELTKPVFESMSAIIEEMAKKNSYDLVYEKSQGGILYSKNPTNITNSVIEKYNKIHK